MFVALLILPLLMLLISGCFVRALVVVLLFWMRCRCVIVTVFVVFVVGVAFVIGLAVGHGLVVVTLVSFGCAVVLVFLLVLCCCDCWFARVL